LYFIGGIINFDFKESYKCLYFCKTTHILLCSKLAIRLKETDGRLTVTLAFLVYTWQLKVPKYISTLAISSFKLQIKLRESFLKKEILYKKIKVLNYIKFL